MLMMSWGRRHHQRKSRKWSMVLIPFWGPLGKGKFAIKAWHSNSSEIDQDGNENPVSLLGHQWKKKADSIALKSETVYTDLSYCTKQKALGVVSQLWDLLGWMAPVTIRFRIDLQNLYQWDEVLPPEEKLKWQKNVGVGDLVLEIDGNCKRGEWQMALVEEVFPGGDNLVCK
ncbi:Hypothetical predicted protein, partial [Paramuricea clavata]